MFLILRKGWRGGGGASRSNTRSPTLLIHVRKCYKRNPEPKLYTRMYESIFVYIFLDGLGSSWGMRLVVVDSRVFSPSVRCLNVNSTWIN